MQGESANAGAAHGDPGAQRWISLDAIRGVAVMGILAMNILAFALPDSASFSPDGPHGVSVADSISWLFAYLFFEGKMRTLFAMLFGASCLLVIRRAEQLADQYLRRRVPGHGHHHGPGDPFP